MKHLLFITLFTLSFANEDYGEYLGDYTYKSQEDEYTILTHLFPVNYEENHHRRRLNHFWKDYKWNKSGNNLKLRIGDCHTSGTTDWSRMLTDVIYNWNNVPEHQDGSGDIYNPTNVTFIASNCASGDIKSYNIQADDKDYGDTSWLGLASIYLRNGYVVSAMSQVNEYHSLSNSQWQHVLCQEIGHGFPLDHQSESGVDKNTCMDYDRNLGNKYPNHHDVKLLDVLYGNLNISNFTDTNTDNNKYYYIIKIFWKFLFFFIIFFLIIPFGICSFIIYKCTYRN